MLPAQDHANRMAAALLAVAAILGPIAIGGTGDWVRLGLEATMTIAVVLWAFTSSCRSFGLLWPIATSGLVLLQVLPLPDSLLGSLAPVSAGAWKVAHQGLALSWGCISIDPAATLVAGRRLLLGLATIAAVSDLASNVGSRKFFQAALAVSGAVILTLALLFPVSNETRMLLGFVPLGGPVEHWRSPVAAPVETSGWAYLEWVNAGAKRYLVDLRVAGDGFGPYIVSNHFAGAVSLTFPFTVAAWLFLSRGRVHPAVRYLVTLVMLAGALWLVGPVASSRAGFASLLLASLTLIACTVEHRLARRIATAAAGCYALILLAFVIIFLGQFRSIGALAPEAIRPRVAAALADGRVVAASAAARMFVASPILGTGLSTYGDLYPRVMQAPITWYYAHNDWAQLVAEAGLVGLAALATLVAVMLRRFGRFFSQAIPPQRLLDAGSWAALTGIAAHSFFDWNLHVPANALLACITTGLAAASGTPAAISSRTEPNPTLRIASRIALSLACVGSLVLLARDAHSSSVCKRMQMALVEDGEATKKNEPKAARPVLAAAVAFGEDAAAWDPGNPRLAVLLGQVHLRLALAAAAESPADLQAQAGHEATAEGWFLRARRQCAACRGLPEPVPQAPRK